jgi:hypothetical protein
MYHFAWLTLNWPWPVFVIAVVVSIAAFFVVTRVTGALALSLVLYLGVSWSLWFWVPPAFWTLWVLGLVGYIVFLATERLGYVGWYGSVVALAIVLVLVIGSGLGAMISDSSDNDASHNDLNGLLTQPTATVTAAPVDLGLTDKQSKQIASDLSKIYRNYKPGQVQTGVGSIPDKTREAATLSFTGKTIKNREMLSEFFKSDTKLARQARARVRHALLSKGYTEAEVQRAFTNADHWFWVAPTVASQISGTTYPVKGDIVKERGARAVAPNDAIWFYVTSDAHVLKNASLRADCMNPEVTTVTPIPPGTTPPPISQPPCIKPSKPAGGGAYVYNSTNCTWHKPGQTFDEMQNQSPAHQDVQDNSTSGVNTGHTPGASTPPAPQPTQPANTSSPAPPTPGGYNGGSTQQPGQTAPPTPVVPSSDPTNTGDPGGF